MPRLTRALTLVVLLFLPSIAFAQASAQASITGVVRDTSGAVLPGVTVEATSPALTEKIRTAVTDGSGQYRIVDLRVGTYAVTFSLPGFSVVRREGIELEGAFTATINVELRVGSLEETITVTGESPIVDVQSTRRQQILNNETINEIPSGRSYFSLVALVPGVTTSTNSVGGLGGPATVTFTMHGGPTNEGRLQVDGMGVGSTLNGGGVSYYVADVGNAQEIVFTTSGGLGEAEVGGPVMSIVPKTGSNTLRGMFFANGATSAMQSNNFTQRLRDAGLVLPSTMRKLWDVNGSIGGPIVRDRFWYFLTSRHQGNRADVTNMYYNANAGNPLAWRYEPDLNRPAFNDGTWKNTSLRLSLQATPRNSINVFWDEQTSRLDHIGGGSPTTSPEAAATTDSAPLRARQITWRSPATSRLLLEGGFGVNGGRWGGRERKGNLTRDLIRATEQGGAIPGLTYRSMNWNSHLAASNRWRAAASYITGAHSMKFGYEGTYLINDQKAFTNNHRLTYRFNNGVPNQFTFSGQPFELMTRTASHSVYAQEQWTTGRLTLQSALRYDRAWSFFPQQQVGPERFIPVAIVLPAEDGVKGFNDISPRVGVAYDLFGTGRTSLKGNIGRYLQAASNAARYTATNPLSRISTSTSRSWTDANGNLVPDCNLLGAATQDLRASGGDFCGAWANANFGSPVPGTVYDPEILEGWGVRPFDWQVGLSVQHEVLPRTSVEVGYFRRWFGNFDVTDNLAVTSADYNRYSVTAPRDARLPDGGGYVVDDLWAISEAKFGQTQNFVTAAGNFGEQIEYWQGVDVNVNVRIRQGLTFQGGTSTGRTVTDSCDVIVDNPSRRNCHVALPFLTQVKALGSYIVPKIDVLVSGTLQSRPGNDFSANWVVPSAVVAQTLGRPLAGNAANVTVDLLNPGQRYSDRVNQVDFRVGKILRLGGKRVNLNLDLFNAFNVSPVLAINQTFVPNGAWLVPTSVLAARFAKVSGQIDF